MSLELRRVPFGDAVIRDTLYGLRVMRRNPVLAAVAILSLALGIGANAAVFHLIDAVRLRTLPVANAQELAEVRADGVHGFGVSADVNAEITYPLWEQIRARQTAFTGIFAWGNTALLVGRGAEARRARGLWVSGDFFRVLGIKPALGRLFTGADDYRGCAGAVVVSFDLPAATLPLERRLAFQQQLTSAIRSVPGVARAAAATNYPLSGAIWSHFFRLAGSPGDEQRVSRFTYVSPGYFDTLRIPILAGRDLRDLDTAASGRVLLVNESFVRGHLGGRNAIGTMLRTVAEPGYPETTYEIVGVVGNTKYADLRDEPCWCAVPAGGMPPIAYVPIAQDPGLQPWASILVRTGRPPAEIRSAIARRVAELNPAIAVQFTDLPSQIRGRLVAERTMAWLAGAFGVLAMALVAVGLYGTIGYVAVSRRNEIGIRVALGCTRAGVVMLVLGEQFWLLAAGLAIGLPLALGAARFASTAFFGLSPAHIPTLLGAVSLLASTAAMAGGIPAWTAAKISPDLALRSE